MFDTPRSPEEIVGWVQRAVAMAPTEVAGQADLARALAFAGRVDEARRIEQMLLERHPNNPVVRRLAKDVR